MGGGLQAAAPTAAAHGLDPWATNRSCRVESDPRIKSAGSKKGADLIPQIQHTIRHDHRVPADAAMGEHLIVLAQLDGDAAWPTHFMALAQYEVGLPRCEIRLFRQ
ncbi:hypothetical protein D9M68_874330 [compost metagenome]